jgi:hypothetical protein
MAGLAALAAPCPSTAGTTIIGHGFAPLTSEPPAWTLTMARAILAAAGDPSDCGAIATEAPVGTVFTYRPDSGEWQHHCGSAIPNGEIVLVFNWSQESDGLNLGGTQGYAEAAADALYAALRDPQLPSAFAGEDLLAPDVHFIGHSRGAVVDSDCAERLAAAGIAVDQVTTLDSHSGDGTLDYPLDAADWGDRAPVTWTNVGFADNYWRADGGGIPWASDFDGMPLGSDVDLDLGDAIEGFPDVDPVFEHTEVHAWYHGTIDLTANDDGNGTAIDAEPFTQWYADGGIPARHLTGFYHAAIRQGTRPPPAAGTDPSHSPFSIYNGDFEIVNTAAPKIGIGFAGWLYHGGDKAGVLVPWSSADPPPGSTYYLTLFAGADNRSLTHNRLYVDDAVAGIELDRRVALPSPNDRFKITLVDGVADTPVADVPLPAATAWETLSFPIPAENAGRTYAVRFEIDGGGDGVESIVDVDSLRFVPEPESRLLLGSGIAGLLLLGRRRAKP